MARSGDVARIARSSGHDFLFIDIQHSIYTLETIAHIAQVALGCGVAPFVRVRSCRDPDISVMLDLRGDGDCGAGREYRRGCPGGGADLQDSHRLGRGR